MTKHPAPPTTTRQLIVDRIHDRIDALTQPSTTVESQWRTAPPWIWLRLCAHVVEHASLLEQLRVGVPASTAGVSASAPGSKPPASITALSLLATITVEARRWVEYGFGLTTVDVHTDLLELRSRAATIDHHDDLDELDRCVTRWWAHARVATTWDTAPLRPHVPCPAEGCGHRGGLRVTQDPLAAVCLECDSAWDATTIDDLGAHVRMMLEVPDSIEDIDVEHDASAAVGTIEAALTEFETRLAVAPSVLQGTTYSA